MGDQSVQVLLSCLTAIMVYELWTRKLMPRWLTAGVVGAVVLLQVGGILLRAKADTLHNYYLPAVAYLEKNATPDDLIFASLELFFKYGTRPNWTDDIRWGYRSGKKPSYLVVEQTYEENMKGWRTKEPLLAKYMEDMMQNGYTLVYEHGEYKIYKKKQ